MRTSSVFLIVIVLVALSFSLQVKVNAQTTYITVYGQLTQFQCPVGAVSGPCTGFSLMTNGTTPGIPATPMLDFSQSVVPAPAQTDIGKNVAVTGYYGQESPCMISGCPAFFVHIWGPYYESSSGTTITCSTSSNPAGYSVQCGTAPPLPLGESTGGPNPLAESLSLSSIQLVVIAIIVVAAAAYLLTQRKH